MIWTFYILLWKRGLFEGVFSESPFLEILEILEFLELLENLQTVENKGESDHFLEILENPAPPPLKTRF